MENGSGRSAGTSVGRRAAETPEVAKKKRKTKGGTPGQDVGQGSTVRSQSRSLKYDRDPENPHKIDLVGINRKKRAEAEKLKSLQDVTGKKRKKTKVTPNPGIEEAGMPGSRVSRDSPNKKGKKKMKVKGREDVAREPNPKDEADFPI